MSVENPHGPGASYTTGGTRVVFITSTAAKSAAWKPTCITRSLDCLTIWVSDRARTPGATPMKRGCPSYLFDHRQGQISARNVVKAITVWAWDTINKWFKWHRTGITNFFDYSCALDVYARDAGNIRRFAPVTGTDHRSKWCQDRRIQLMVTINQKKIKNKFR